MTTHSDSSMISAIKPRAGWAIAAMAALLLLALILVPLGILGLVRNRDLNAQNTATSQDILNVEATRVNQTDRLQQDLAQVHANLAPLVADWPASGEAAQALDSAADVAIAVGAQLVGIEPLADGDDSAAPAAIARRYRLQVRGSWSSLLRFFAQLESGQRSTLRLDSASIAPGEPPVGRADVTVYASDLALELATPTPMAAPATGATPTLDQAVVAEILRLESMMHASRLTGAWADFVSYGERILELDPGRPSAVQMLYEGQVQWATALVAQGDVEGARSHFAAALRLMPTGAEALEGLEALDRPTATPEPTQTMAPPTITPTPTPTIYRVRYGDTLSGIAARYRVTIAELMQANNLRDSRIYVNQTLIIPGR